ncbi:MAG: DinB family protein, partial [Ignavibacteriae bacterium]|nr:DinB family protein [Ignavibacteriota bacterium]
MNNLENYLIQTTKISAEKLFEISDETAEIKKAADKWSRKEILGHLIDSAIVNYSRFMNAVSKDDLVFKTYPQD